MNLLRLPARSGFAVTLSLWLCVLCPDARAVIDLNNDGIPDVWAMVYESRARAASGDNDGDGQTNGSEAIAGTNPFAPASTVRIRSVATSAGAVQLTAATERGKKYQVQSTVTLNPPDWQPE